MSAHRQFSQNDKERIVEMRIVRRMTWAEIGKVFGFAKSTIMKRVAADAFFDDFWNDPKFKTTVGGRLRTEEIVDLLQEGKTTQQIADMLGVKKDTIQGRISRHNLRDVAGAKRGTTYPPLSAERIALAKSYLDEGYSYKAVSDLTGHDDKSIKRYLPGYQGNGAVARSMRMTEYHMYKKINEVWGLSNAA